MFARIRQALAPPVFEGDEEKTRIARLLNGALMILLATTILGSIAVIAAEPPSEWPFSIAFGTIITVATLGMRVALQRGHVRAIGAIMALVLWAGITTLLAFSGGVGNNAVIAYFLLIGVTNLLLGRHLGIAITGLILLSVAGLFFAEFNGWIESQVRESTQLTDAMMLAIALILTTIVARYVVQSSTQALERARRGEFALAERHRELAASQRVTFAASERMSPDELLGLVVDLIRDQFHLYHVQAYIADMDQQVAVLRESTGYAGFQLLEKGHRIPLDQPALVTKAIREGSPVLVADVEQSPDFMSNPLLPDTRSELVVPLKIGERVIGVLDAQAREPGRFTTPTVNLFQTMADQIAFLYENSELIEGVSKQTEALTTLTTQLRTASDIATRMSTFLDPEKLLQEAVELMQSRFGLYHAHIYVLDKDVQKLIVQAGSGEIGRVLRERRYSIPLDAEHNAVARAARTRKVVLIKDASIESDFAPTPLLPQTRSEAAVPLVLGNEALGVLDLQDSQAMRFSQADVDAFSILSGQIAAALQNATLFEQVKMASEQLRDAGQFKDDLLTKTNHELRTPLNSIIGYAEIMQMEIRDKLEAIGELDQAYMEYPTSWGRYLNLSAEEPIQTPERAYLEYAQGIYENGQQLLNVINNLLDLAGIEAGHVALDIEEVEVKSLVDEVSSDVAKLRVSKPVTLVTEIEEQLPTIQADRARLKQILSNVVANVANYTVGESIKLRAFADTNGRARNGWVCFTLEENGARQTLDKRNRTGNFASWSVEWASLGLLLTQHLVEMHGGSIDTFDQIVGGSVLTVRLPIQPPTRRAVDGAN